MPHTPLADRNCMISVSIVDQSQHFSMSERRRRRANEDTSDNESENSHVDGSESESDASVADDQQDAAPPNYDEAVKLETEVKETKLTKNQSIQKPREDGTQLKKDPAFVPRSERFFLHDDRDDAPPGNSRGAGGRGGRGGGRQGGSFERYGVCICCNTICMSVLVLTHIVSNL